jgi:hypothetical protein
VSLGVTLATVGVGLSGTGVVPGDGVDVGVREAPPGEAFRCLR